MFADQMQKAFVYPYILTCQSLKTIWILKAFIVSMYNKNTLKSI
jgi:type II secretory pathway component PulF